MTLEFLWPFLRRFISFEISPESMRILSLLKQKDPHLELSGRLLDVLRTSFLSSGRPDCAKNCELPRR